MVKLSKVDKKKQFEDLTNKMNEAVKKFQVDPQDELEFLNSMTKFKNYSTRNVLLITAQYKGAYGVGSYKEFQKLGYQVQKGEKSIYIQAPKYDDYFKGKNGVDMLAKFASKQEKEDIKSGKIKTKKEISGFLQVPVFDITQTNCPPEDYPKLYPNKPENYNFNGNDEDFKSIKKALDKYANEKNIKVSDGKTHSAAKGFYIPDTNEIVLKDSLNKYERTKVLLHELAHAEMHNKKSMMNKEKELTTPNVKEYQAEMTAYVVSNNFGLDSEDYSKSYLASWTKRNVEDSVYIKSLEEVKDVSLKMIDNIVEKYNEIKQTESISLDEKIAVKLNFLTDENGNNFYRKYQNDNLQLTGINTISKTKLFSDYQIELKDSDNNKFQYSIRSEKSEKEIGSKWNKEMTGKEWLNEDIKTEVLRRKPNLNIDNKIADSNIEMKPIAEFTKEKKVSELKL